MNNYSNTQKILGNLVSLEAWYAPIKANRKSDLMVDLVFKEATFGGGKEDKVQFRVHLKNAELRVVLDPAGNLKIPKKGVLRSTTEFKGKTSLKKSEGSDSKHGYSGDVSANKKGLDANLKASSQKEFIASDTTDTELTVEHGLIACEHSLDEDKNNCWTFAPVASDTMLGRAWGGATKVLELKPKQETKVEDAVKVQIRCKREDIEISDIKYIAQDKAWHKLPPRQKTKERLAEEIIKDNLMKEGLGDPDLNNAFSVVMIADILAEEE